MLPPDGLSLISKIRKSLHSMLTCDSFTRGDLTRSPGTGVRPVTWNSSTSGGNSAEVVFTCLINSSETMFTTKSPVRSMLLRVSFGCPSAFRNGQKQTTGGFMLAAVKKLNGARLQMPAGLTVETKAIGRGTIAPTITLYTFGKPAESGSMITLQCISEPDLSLVAGHFEIPHALLSARIIDIPIPSCR